MRPQTAPRQRPLSPAELAVMDRINQKLISEGLSWSELARRVGRTISAGKQWSGRRAFPTQRTFTRIAEVLGVTQAWLLRGDEEDRPPVARTKRQAEVLALMMEMSPDQEAAAVAALKGLAAHLTKK
jgi:transcriptional regulator with XRE-family HTH domain